MIITAWHQANTVQLLVPDGYLVYDGLQFVKPERASTVMLIQGSSPASGQHYPVQELGVLPDFTAGYHWVCSIISVVNSATSVQDVLASIDPLAGVCLCGITCFGPKILNVPITQGN